MRCYPRWLPITVRALSIPKSLTCESECNAPTHVHLNSSAATQVHVWRESRGFKPWGLILRDYVHLNLEGPPRQALEGTSRYRVNHTSHMCPNPHTPAPHIVQSHPNPHQLTPWLQLQRSFSTRSTGP